MFSIVAILAAGLAYFMLGALWFTPLFGKQWDRAVGFVRPEGWTPSAIYYVGPLVGCLVASAATALLQRVIQPISLPDALLLGLIVGIGFGVTITGVNAIAPNMPRPGLYAAVTGSYHLTGLLVASAILYWFA